MDEFERAEAALAALNRAENQVENQDTANQPEDEFTQAEVRLAAMIDEEAAAELIESNLYAEALETEELAPTTDEGQTENATTMYYPSETLEDILNLETIENPIVEIKTRKINSSAYNEPGYLTIKEIKTELKPILQDLYPDRWDWNSKDEIVIYFPKLIITNSRNETHDIKDLYVKLKYNHVDKTFNGNCAGARLSITRSELNSGYAHSHLRSVNESRLGSFEDFCLGSSTLSYLLSDLATFEMTKNKLEDIKLKFLLVLMELENYLNWESLEGVPYQYISRINDGLLENLVRSTTVMYTKNILKYVWLDILENKYKFQLKFNRLGLLEIINNDNFLIIISKYCDPLALVYRNGTGEFYSQKIIDEHRLDKLDSDYYLIFKGEKLYPKLINEIIKYEKSGKDFAHPQIISECTRVIQKSINENWTEELAGKVITYYSQRERKVKDTNKSLFTNLTHVWDNIPC